LKDRWGHCLAIGKQKVKLPKGTAAEELTLQDCLAFAGDISLDPEKPKKKKAATKTTATKKASKADSKKTGTKKTASNGTATKTAKTKS